jgi:hypothetical protein
MLQVYGAVPPVAVSVELYVTPFSPVGSEVVVIVGPNAFTVKATLPLVPLAVVTVTFLAPLAAEAAMVNVAVIEVLLATFTFATVTPLPLTATVLLVVKFVPVSVTFTLLPGSPFVGVTCVRVGGLVPPFTVNVTALLVPEPFIAVTLRAPPAAFAAAVAVNVILVPEPFTTTLLGVTPLPEMFTLPPKNCEPDSVTEVIDPGFALLGLMLVMAGTPTTRKLTVELVPPEVVTLTVRRPAAALRAIAKFAVACVLPFTVMLLTVTPVPLTVTDIPATKFVPVSVTLVVAPT